MSGNTATMRELVNAIIIDNIKDSVEAGTQYDSSVPQSRANEAYHITGRDHTKKATNKNIYNYINEAKFKAVLEEAKKSREDKTAIAEARQIFVDAMNNPEFAEIMREDFDVDDIESNLGYCHIIAQAVQGIGIDDSNIGIPDSMWADRPLKQTTGMTAKQEFDKTLLTCITGQKPIEDNWLIKALIGLNEEDNQKMADAPSFENLARASDFIGTSTSWVLAFKDRQQKNKIDTAIAAQRDSINKLANHKAQIVQTMSSNMGHIKDNNKLLYKLDLWSQATNHQSTGFRLAQKALKYSPEVILKWSQQRLSQSINKAKPHSILLPASINTSAITTSSSSRAPIAIDFQKTYGISQKMTDVFDNAAAGNKNALTIVTMYTSGESARATQTINQDLDQQLAQLNRDLDPINGQHQQLERSSAGKAALVSAVIGLFQLRSMWIGKNSIGTMAGRGDSLGLEYMTSYASSTLALTSASVDVVNAGIQMKAARSAWVARLGLSVGVLGAVGAGFEVYSLELSQQRMIESGSTTSAKVTGVAQVAAGVAGVAGLGYGTLVFASAGAFALPWLGAIMAIAWGVSLIAQWVAFRYDKGHILPIHYWLDASVFGKREMLNSEYPNNPFKIQAMSSIEQDMHAYSLALTEIQVEPKFNTSVQDFNEVLTGQVTVTISQWEANSELAIEFIGIGNQELGIDRKAFNIETLKRQNKAVKTKSGLQVTLDIPKTSQYKPQYLGSVREGTIDPNEQKRMEQAGQRAQSSPNSQIKQLRIIVLYSLNPSINPHYQLRTTVTS